MENLYIDYYPGGPVLPITKKIKKIALRNLEKLRTIEIYNDEIVGGVNGQINYVELKLVNLTKLYKFVVNNGDRIDAFRNSVGMLIYDDGLIKVTR